MRYKLFDINKSVVCGSKWLLKKPLRDTFITCKPNEVFVEGHKIYKAKGRETYYRVIACINRVLLVYKTNYDDIEQTISNRIQTIDQDNKGE